MSLLDQIGPNLPPDKSIADCFNDPKIRQFFDRLAFSSGQLDSTYIGTAPANVRSIITEAMASSPSAAIPGSDEEAKRRDEMNLIIERVLSSVWARFSQEVKQALAAAEAAKDVNLLAKLSQDYLDVQRKMKEFNSFYGQN